MEKKEEKKGFWASLFAPKPCGCSCGSQIEEVKEETPQQEVTEKGNDGNEREKTPTCDCGGNC